MCIYIFKSAIPLTLYFKFYFIIGVDYISDDAIENIFP